MLDTISKPCISKFRRKSFEIISKRTVVVLVVIATAIIASVVPISDWLSL